MPTLLSQVLVAFTIELDNEFEHRMPHRTATTGSRRDPWLTSMVMWFNCLRFLGERGLTVGQLEALARTKTNVDGMRRWGYLTFGPDPEDPRPKPPQSAWLLRLTSAGRKADATWRPIFDEIEARWRERFGTETVHALRHSLDALAVDPADELPDCLPIFGYGMVSRAPEPKAGAADAPRDRSLRHLLVVQLARVLNAFAIEFDAARGVSLAVSSNVLRLLDEDIVPLRRLPSESGVSKEAIAMAFGPLRKLGLIADASEAGARERVIRLTATGAAARDTYFKRLARVEIDWESRYGQPRISELRASLQSLVGDGTSVNSPLFRGLEPYPDGWRASVRRPVTLPHYPMVLHRGGYPDGS